MKKEKKKFIKNTVMFCIILILVVVLLNVLYTNTIEQDKKIVRKEIQWQEYKQNISELEYAFFGDSHVQDAINPRYINGSFNFAVSGQNYIETYYVLRKIQEQDNIQVKNIVLEIDMHSFSPKLRTQERLFRDLSYYSAFVPLQDIAELKNENVLSLFVLDTIKIVGKGSEMVSYIIHRPELADMQNGWVNNTNNFSQENKTEMAQVQYQNYFNEDKELFEDTSLEYFLKILELAQEKEIGVVFVRYPVSYEYSFEIESHNISEQEYYSELFRQINNTAVEYSVLDYHDVFFTQPEYLADSDHVNEKGSTILSKAIGNDLQKIQTNSVVFMTKRIE